MKSIFDDLAVQAKEEDDNMGKSEVQRQKCVYQIDNDFHHPIYRAVDPNWTEAQRVGLTGIKCFWSILDADHIKRVYQIGFNRATGFVPEKVVPPDFNKLHYNHVDPKPTQYYTL